MAQTKQMMGGTGYSVPGATPSAPGMQPPTQAKAPATISAPAPVLTVDSLMRGHIQYKNPDGKLTTLLVFNRQSGEELLKKEYVDGFINEYLNLGRYKLPLEQIGIVIKNISGEILEDLTPMVTKKTS